MAKDFILINNHKHIRYEDDSNLDGEISLQKSEEFLRQINRRRSIRTFSDKPVSKNTIENIIKSASTAPSGAHKQPWTFCAISNAEIKKQIRIAAEEEEKISYEGRMSERWKDDLAHLGTDMHKPFLENAPWLIIAFKKVYDLDENGEKQNNYYVNESVGIACGFLIAAIHNAGLATLTHTPSPMNFLEKILNRPKNERAYILFPVGYAHDETYVPDITRKPLDKVSEFYE
ncbi:nitroreductase family protein [Frigoriflavimonas asaccharolytica]|uniref:Nitroreductase n=1 Tax=Frigoriflavimonas asaccharolytica TaxID=2735899 RepID=A0A8J8K8D6_9FLAO|nr:nitroreductase family protein [Frigoriflavimonas asaccharolytica]NRS92506.1 nitroreductase [Frigoriflavimonas asaccharolytica]